MACVTLKRTYDHSVRQIPATPCHYQPRSVQQQQNQDDEANASPFNPRPSKRRRMASSHKRWKQNKSREHELLSSSELMSSSSPPKRCGSSHAFPSVHLTPASLSGSASIFKESSLSPAEIAAKLRDELKRLRKRKQIPKRSTPPSSPEPKMDDATALRAATSMFQNSSSSTVQPASPVASTSGGPVKDKPIFTLKQMTLICEKMCKDRTDCVRAEYDKILQQKLGEQYDAFVKFIDHQIEQRFSQASAPSYLS